jgi:hypothetical protein
MHLVIRNSKTGQFANCGTTKRLPPVKTDRGVRSLEQLIGYWLFSFKDRAEDCITPFFVECYTEKRKFKALISSHGAVRTVEWVLIEKKKR